MRPVWEHLLFLHWRVEPSQLRRQLPPGLELDLYDGKAYIGLVPFTMRHVRPRRVPPFRVFTDFHEINVRTYVHRAGHDTGVWFFSLDAASIPAVCAARAWYKLPYFAARMGLTCGANNRIDYSTRRLWPPPLPATCTVSYTPFGEATPARPGTLDHFLVERYILYSYANNRLFSGRVHHTPYALQSAELHSLQESLIAAALVERGDETPVVHYCRQVQTEIFNLQPVASQSG
jgi:uncharacterized protein YqjF (DUF2071 family)